MDHQSIKLTDRNGDRYPCNFGSDIIRDGMYLEVTALRQEAVVLLEVFYSDLTKRLTVSVFEEDVCAELLEQAISVARDRLAPKNSHIPN